MTGGRHLFVCHVCGLDDGDDMPWGEDGNSPTFNICSCCGTTFGYQDTLIEGIRNHRKKWLESGAKWFWPKARPADWNLEKQLAQIPDQYR